MDTPDSPAVDEQEARDVRCLNEALLNLIAEFGPLTVATAAADQMQDADLLAELIAELVGDHDKCELYRDEAGEWRWRLVDGGNHEPFAGPQEGYVNHGHARRMARRATGRRPVTLDQSSRQ